MHTWLISSWFFLLDSFSKQNEQFLIFGYITLSNVRNYIPHEDLDFQLQEINCSQSNFDLHQQTLEAVQTGLIRSNKSCTRKYCNFKIEGNDRRTLNIINME